MTRISIETWHLYGVERAWKEFGSEMALAQQIESQILNWNHEVSRWWFHDDVLPRLEQVRSTDSWRWQLFMNRAKESAISALEGGKTTYKIQNEYDLIRRALDESIPEIAGGLEEWGWWEYEEEKRIVQENIDGMSQRKKKKIRLMWYRQHSDIPSCEVLDYTFYKKRLLDSPLTITLIHEDMQDQQTRVKQLFQMQNKEPRIIVVFHDGAKVTKWEYWWNQKDDAGILSEIINSNI